MNEIKYIDPVIKTSDAIKMLGRKVDLAKFLGVRRSTVTCYGEYLPTVSAYRVAQVYPELNQNPADRPA